jgi:hypothetical protein
MNRPSHLGELLDRVQCGAVRPPRQVKRDVPAALEVVCLKAMALRPADRYAAVLALAADPEGVRTRTTKARRLPEAAGRPGTKTVTALLAGPTPSKTEGRRRPGE